MPRMPPWTEEEFVLLRQGWERGGRVAAHQLLPHRTKDALAIQAQRLKLQSPRAWREDELKALRDLYPSGGSEAVLKVLPNRSYDAVTLQAKKIGLRYTAHWWTDEERQRACEAYAKGGLPAARLAAPNRSDRALEIVANLPSSRSWTAAEERLLRINWTQRGAAAAIAALPNRTPTAVVGKARRMFLWTPGAPRPWDKVDEEMLRNLYPRLGPTGTAQRMTWRTRRSLVEKAYELGLTDQSRTKDRRAPPTPRLDRIACASGQERASA